MSFEAGDTAEIVQMNVRLRKGRVVAMHALATASGESLSAYADRLLAQDAEKNRDLVIQLYDDEIQAIQATRATVLRELDLNT